MIGEAACSAGKPPPPAEPAKQPKALLQQHCQSARLPMPQYARQAPGGGRAEAGAAALAGEAAASDRVASAARAAALAETADEHASAAESQQAISHYWPLYWKLVDCTSAPEDDVMESMTMAD